VGILIEKLKKIKDLIMNQPVKIIDQRVLFTLPCEKEGKKIHED